MSWEQDKGMIIFLGVLGVFIIFSGFMAIRSAKRQKRETPEQRQLHQTMNQEMTRRGVILFFGILWLASGVLTYVLYGRGLLNQSFKIPRVLTFFYEVFGTTAGTIIQAALSLLVVVLTIRSMVKKRRALLQEFELKDKENE